VLDNQWGFLLWLEEKPNVPEGSVHAIGNWHYWVAQGYCF